MTAKERLVELLSDYSTWWVEEYCQDDTEQMNEFADLILKEFVRRSDINFCDCVNYLNFNKKNECIGFSNKKAPLIDCPKCNGSGIVVKENK